MVGQVRVAKVWVVVLIALTTCASSGILGLGTGHPLPLVSENNALGGKQTGGIAFSPTSEASISSLWSPLNAAANPTSALEFSSPNVQASGLFGFSVASSGGLVVIGAPHENVSGQLDAGHAYVLSAKTGALISTLTSPNAQTYGYFGYSVAISGKTVLVGAPYENVSGQLDAGHAYVLSAKTGALISTLISPNAQTDGYFGYSVAISGKTALIGAAYENVSGQRAAGHAYTFNATTGKRISTLTSPHAQTDGYFGYSVAISGRTVLVGAPDEKVAIFFSTFLDAGHTYTFNATTGKHISTLTSPNVQSNGFFGNSVAVSGSKVVVGARGETASSQFGAGHAYTFNATTGKRISTLISPYAQASGWFGYSVAISGTTVVVGAQDESVSGLLYAGHAYTFNTTTGKLIWTLTSLNAQKLAYFGLSVAISGKTALVGAPEESALSLVGGGHAYQF